MSAGFVRATIVATALLAWLAPGSAAAAEAVVRGTTTAERGAILLPGVEITVTEAETHRPAGVVVSDGLGRFRLEGLAAGRYEVSGRLAGFGVAVAGPIVLSTGQEVEVNLDLQVAAVTETVTVRGQAGMVETQTSAARQTVAGQLIDVLPVAGDSYRSLLPVLPGVLRQQDGRVSMKGARPTQGGLQLGRDNGSDPSTGNFGVELPSDAVESVDVQATPYGAEDGRLSSSLVRVATVAGSNAWRFTANSFVPMPCLRLCDGDTLGITLYQPRGWFGGPLVKDRLFIAQGAQFRWVRTRVPSLPDAANRTTTRSLYLFTRLDANLKPGHTLTATVAAFPRRVDAVNLSTFNPVGAAPNSRLAGYSVGVSEQATLSGTTLLESSLSASLYRTRILGDGDQEMLVTTEGLGGNYFNRQERRTRVFQWTESIQLLRRAGGEHLLKAGFDVMRSAYRGTSMSHPVVVVRADGTVSQRVEFGAETSQRVSGIDAAAFVQDRWRISPRFVLEPGLRVDRDGVLGRTGTSPRFGVVAGVLPRDSGVLKGGVGTFYERTPLNVGAFESFEPASVTRYAADGHTPIGVPLTYVHRAGILHTPRALVWNVEYDHRIGSRLLLKVNHMRRRGSGEAVLEPLTSGGQAELRLSSDGRSRYVETEVSARYGASDLRQLSVSYVRSRSTATQNAYDLFYGDFRHPLVRPDAYATGSTDVPNRLIARGVLTLREKWTVSALGEVRNGFPYSIVDEEQQYVGARNAGGRFPNLWVCDASLLRTATVLKRRVRFGMRFYHVFNTFAPRDVQNNVDSPAFGTFYNGLTRRVTFTLQFLSR